MFSDQLQRKKANLPSPGEHLSEGGDQGSLLVAAGSCSLNTRQRYNGANGLTTGAPPRRVLVNMSALAAEGTVEKEHHP
jgi:hypothetical protein